MTVKVTGAEVGTVVSAKVGTSVAGTAVAGKAVGWGNAVGADVIADAQAVSTRVIIKMIARIDFFIFFSFVFVSKP
jgi:hypothetical protein